MSDPTEPIRREMVAEINAVANTREALETKWGKGNVWTTDELREEFVVTAFLAPFCGVTRKRDGVKGLVQFSHSPRFYFDFEPAGS